MVFDGPENMGVDNATNLGACEEEDGNKEICVEVTGDLHVLTCRKDAGNFGTCTDMSGRV